VIASASGSQLGPIVSGAGHVVLVIGGQKIVSRPRRRHPAHLRVLLPLRGFAARQAYGVPSGVNNLLIINHPIVPGRITAILVNESLGF
jgi:hypothetical protein